MKNYFFIFFLFCFFNSSAQYTSEESEEKRNPLSKLTFKDRLYTGGNVAFGAQNSFVFVEFSPYVGYRVTQKYSFGIGAKYIYQGSKQYGVNWSVYGGSIFQRYKFTENLFAHTEFEFLRAYDQDPNSPTYYQRDFAKMLFIGAGYSSRLGANSSIQIMLLYDLIDDVNSPYRYNYILGPVGLPLIYRIGFNIGL